jgi:hypothetical protein
MLGDEMNHGYDLYIVPKDAVYRPGPAQFTDLIKFLSERLEIIGDWTVDGEDDLPTESAIGHLRASCQAATGGSEATVSFNDLVSGSLFGYEAEQPDADQNYWADELRLFVTSKPFPCADWEYEEAACPACNQRFSQIGEILDEVRLTGDPVTCPCGASTLPEDLKKTPSVSLVQFALIFAGNRGWHYEVKNDRDAIKDEEFLPEIEKLLGTPVEVLAIGH